MCVTDSIFPAPATTPGKHPSHLLPCPPRLVPPMLPSRLPNIPRVQVTPVPSSGCPNPPPELVSCDGSSCPPGRFPGHCAQADQELSLLPLPRLLPTHIVSHSARSSFQTHPARPHSQLTCVLAPQPSPHHLHLHRTASQYPYGHLATASQFKLLVSPRALHKTSRAAQISTSSRHARAR